MGKTFVLNDGRQVWTNSFTGIVIESSSRTETKISSESTVGYTNAQGVTVGGGQSVSSTSLEIRTCWLRSANGTEKEFTFINNNLGYRAGHCLTVVWAGIQGVDSNMKIFIYQHSTDKIWSAFEIASVATAKAIGLFKSPGVLGFLLFMALLISIIGIPIAIGMMIYELITNNSKAQDFKKRAEACFDEYKSEYESKAKELMQPAKSAA